MRRLEEQIIELLGEIDYRDWTEQQNTPKKRNPSASSGGNRTANLWEDLIGVSTNSANTDPFRETFRDGKRSIFIILMCIYTDTYTSVYYLTWYACSRFLHV